MLKSFITSTTLIALAASAAAQTVEVYASATAFEVATGATSVPFPTDASSALPFKPFPSTLTGYSCTDGMLSLPLGGTPIVNITSRTPPAWICFLGPGWNAGSANINPQPLSPTIVISGEADYVLTVATPQYAVGFELLTNFQALETVTLTFSDGATATMDDSQLGTNPNTFAFVGFKSLKPIASVQIDTTAAASQNEGIVAIKVLNHYKVPIDIRPGSNPNNISLGSNGTIPVAILSTSHFDARTVDPTTVTLAGASVARKGNGTRMASTQDVNGDALPDLIIHFDTQALALTESDTIATLTGATCSGTPIKGSDSVRYVPVRK